MKASSEIRGSPGWGFHSIWDALLHMPRERMPAALGIPLDDSPLETFRSASWIPGFMLDLLLVFVTGLVLYRLLARCYSFF